MNDLSPAQQRRVRDMAASLFPPGPDGQWPCSEDMPLLRALTRGAPDPAQALLDDLAEILLLPRHERSEYRDHRGTMPPYKIGKLMLEYAVKSAQIDRIVGALTKGFCARHCDRPPVGCCHILGYDLGLVPEVMLELQRLEAARQEVVFPDGALEEKCRYHTRRGCPLKLFKSPACVRYICPPMFTYLEQRFGHCPGELAVFIAALTDFGNSHFDREKIYEVMDRLIATGEILLATEPST